VIVLVPVAIYSVGYQVARGRPYSRLERRVLEEIASRGGVALNLLNQTFQVHERLLVESVVTLVGAGWVAVTSGREATFVLTEEGKKANESSGEPATVAVTNAAPSRLVMEATTGQLARSGEVQTLSPKEARLKEFPCTPIRILRTSLDESQVQKLLRRAPDEWVRSINRPLLTAKWRYVAARVDPEAQIVTELPRGWYQALTPILLDVAQRRLEEAADDEGVAANLAGNPFPWLRSSQQDSDSLPSELAIPVSVVAELHGRSHDDLFAQALAVAKQNVMIASPIVSSGGVERRSEAIAAAVQRGVRVDVLYGDTAEDMSPKDIVASLNQVGYEAAKGRGRELLRPAKAPRSVGR
jgi:hypothetical protein